MIFTLIELIVQCGITEQTTKRKLHAHGGSGQQEAVQSTRAVPRLCVQAVDLSVGLQWAPPCCPVGERGKKGRTDPASTSSSSLWIKLVAWQRLGGTSKEFSWRMVEFRLRHWQEGSFAKVVPWLLSVRSSLALKWVSLDGALYPDLERLQLLKRQFSPHCGSVLGLI